MLYELIDAGRHQDARGYYETLTSLSLDVVRWFVDQADDLEGELALHFLNLAHWLDPEDADIAAKVK